MENLEILLDMNEIEHIEKQSNYNGELYIIKGVNTRARSYPLIAERKYDGQKVKFRWDNSIKEKIA